MSGALDRLRTGTLDWLQHHLDYFDPSTEAARSSAHGKAKAALELALLCHCAARPGTCDDPRADQATDLVRTLWQRTDLAGLLGAEPRYAASYALASVAFAPGGIDERVCRGALAALAGDELSAAGASPYQRLELRYYADKAGVPHTLEPYEELAAAGVLATLPAAVAERRPAPGEAPVTIPEAYALTHSSFYLSDFGATAPQLPAGTAASALPLVHLLLGHCVEREWWDLAAELLLTGACLGAEPLAAPWGAEAVACLARAQQPDGSIPGRSPRTAATAADPAAVRFEKGYHTTLVTALMALVVSRVRVA
ncbi:DUF6895 family protein [Streptomyces sp. NPDC020917]|uniref:DUF6895 family protein n=1 Tax=Streptomyces sp. NPDC020917 TaxID=3365102 RepID=UPI0037AFE856